MGYRDAEDALRAQRDAADRDAIRWREEADSLQRQLAESEAARRGLVSLVREERAGRRDSRCVLVAASALLLGLLALLLRAIS